MLNEALDRLIEMLKRAAQVEPDVPAAAFVLATATRDGRPSARPVFVDIVPDEGIVFFARQGSGKAIQMAENPQVSLSLYQSKLQQQCAIDGVVELLDESQSDAHWTKRDRATQIAAWVSQQGDAATAESTRDAISKTRQQYSFEPVPRPSEWRAWLLKPQRIEFWGGGWGRLNDRCRYLLGDDGWSQEEIQA